MTTTKKVVLGKRIFGYDAIEKRQLSDADLLNIQLKPSCEALLAQCLIGNR
jgi:hypothetical protein